MSIITASNLRKTYRSRGNRHIIGGIFKPDWRYKHAVEEVSLVIEPGESVAFLGPNGAGKTTTTKMLTGLIYPSAGKLKVLGYTPFDRNHNFLKNIGLVMGNKAGLNWDLSAQQSFSLLQKIYDIPMSKFEQRVEELCAMLNVKHVLDTQVRRLSLGERMKLELVGAILHDPGILFLDEPTIGLDIGSKKSVREFLRYLHSQGKTLILTSHDMDDIAEVCQRVIVINHGKIIYDDSMVSLNKQYAHVRYARLEFADKVPSQTQLKTYGRLVSLNDSVAVLGIHKSEVMQAATKIAEDFPLQDITIEQVPLEVIISDLYGKV
ncbi:MAG TPA: ATP-binding cassette domain-containing protein [Patescibacteria group bacterium]|jgi:ABC-2 type transport system ATP-binding protein|nr:ATP-binding cassette domain-containing protein [Patescibacteria group bacterium]